MAHSGHPKGEHIMGIHKVAAIAGAAAMAATALGATAASAGTGPAGAHAGGGNAPAASSSSRGHTYLNEHGTYPYSHVVYAPSKFYLLAGRSASIYTSPTYWPSWHQNSAVGEGYMYGVRHGYKVYVGNVTMVFSNRKTNAHFTSTGQRYAYFENVRISGIRPGNGGSVQNWHWSWGRDNWVVNR
jgi:hypothetical protein